MYVGTRAQTRAACHCAALTKGRHDGWGGLQLSLFERHHSIDQREASFSSRLFICLFINTSIIMVLVNTRLQGLDNVQGATYSDFVTDWYAVVLCAPHARLLLTHCVGMCIRTCTCLDVSSGMPQLAQTSSSRWPSAPSPCTWHRFCDLLSPG